MGVNLMSQPQPINDTNIGLFFQDRELFSSTCYSD